MSLSLLPAVVVACPGPGVAGALVKIMCIDANGKRELVDVPWFDGGPVYYRERLYINRVAGMREVQKVEHRYTGQLPGGLRVYAEKVLS